MNEAPSTGNSFSLTPGAFWGMTGPKFGIKVAPRQLYERFGYPLLNDGDSESLGTYVFTSESGRSNQKWRNRFAGG